MSKLRKNLLISCRALVPTTSCSLSTAFLHLAQAAGPWDTFPRGHAGSGFLQSNRMDDKDDDRDANGAKRPGQETNDQEARASRQSTGKNARLQEVEPIPCSVRSSGLRRRIVAPRGDDQTGTADYHGLGASRRNALRLGPLELQHHGTMTPAPRKLFRSVRLVRSRRRLPQVTSPLAMANPRTHRRRCHSPTITVASCGLHPSEVVHSWWVDRTCFRGILQG